jgi:Uma2 family endonuclease
MTISPTKSVIAELERLPQLPLVVQELQETLAAEQKRRQEFYATMKEDDKVEFINGQIVFQSPVKNRHSEAGESLFLLLKAYVRKHKLGRVGIEKLLVSLTRNDYEPDIAFWRQDLAAQFTPDQMRFPAPDLVVEVLSPSTELIDRDTKFKDYEAHGVSEYWLLDPDTETVEQNVLRDGQYALLMKSATGMLTSVAVNGFSIPVRAIFDPAENFAVLGKLV